MQSQHLYYLCTQCVETRFFDYFVKQTDYHIVQCRLNTALKMNDNTGTAMEITGRFVQ